MKRFSLLLAALFFFSTLMGTTAVLSVIDAGEGWSQERPRKSKTKRKRRRSPKPTSFIGVRVAGILTAPGELTVGDNSAKFEDESGAGVGGLIVFPIQNNIRGGASIWFFPAFEAAREGADVDGTMIELNAQGEFVVPMSREVDGYGFGEAGVAILNANDSDLGDFLGFNFGGGVGAQILVSGNFAIRGEGKFEFYNISNNNDVETTLNASRVLLTVGGMFGL